MANKRENEPQENMAKDEKRKEGKERGRLNKARIGNEGDDRKKGKMNRERE